MSELDDLGSELGSQQAEFRDMLVLTHRLPHTKITRGPGDPRPNFVSRESYRNQLKSVGFRIVPDRLRDSREDKLVDGKYVPDAPLLHPPAVYGIGPKEKTKTIAVVYPEGWQAVVPEEDPNRFQIVDEVGGIAVAVYAKQNLVTNSGFPVFRVAIRGVDENMRV